MESNADKIANFQAYVVPGYLRAIETRVDNMFTEYKNVKAFEKTDKEFAKRGEKSYNKYSGWNTKCYNICWNKII